MLDALPLQEDFEEAAPVYQALTAIAVNPSLSGRVIQVKPQLMAALEAAVHQQEIPQAVKEGILQAHGVHSNGNGTA